MTTTVTASGAHRPLRLWPGVLLLAVQWLLWLVLPAVAPDAEVFSLPLGFIALVGSAVCGIAIAAWWLLFSKAAWVDRIGALALVAAAMVVTGLLRHESVAGPGVFLLFFGAVPGLSFAFVAWAVATRRYARANRFAALAAVVAVALVPWTLVRTAGVVGNGSEYHWRWTPTPEERLLARGDEELRPAPVPAPVDAPPIPASIGGGTPESLPAPPSAKPVESAVESKPRNVSDEEKKDPASAPRVSNHAEWPGFRGRERDSIVRAVQIDTDWAAAPPAELWRRSIGPGWSSFAVSGDLLYTQEQRGDDEIVACYRVSSGEPVWRHRDQVRFWESNGGAGPRATPTLHDGRVYAFGATGILNALDATTGKVLWARNVSGDVNRAVPEWGFASSPLVIDDVVVVAAAGTLVAYDRERGDLRWQGPRYGGSYSSPHRTTINGVDQVILLGGPGVISVAAASGAVLWEHKWVPGAIVQPALMPDGDVLVNAIAATGGVGTRRLHVTRDATEWRVEERWTTNGLKPFFNDYVIHEGHAYGFDNNILASIDLADGTRKWKGGRFGNGQLLLLADQDLLLVLSEDGELALVRAAPDKFTEVARYPALNAKTWNHPVLVGNTLLVRNGEEMAAFRLATAPR
jgi:outer membrane protein assembly factor BamB